MKADLPIKELGDEAPLYDRPCVPTPKPPVVDPASDRRRRSPTATRCSPLLATPNLCSKRWVWEQYDHLILGNTRARAGRRRGGDSRRRRSQGPGADDRRDRALLRRRSGRGRQAGGGGGLAQYHRARRDAAGAHRQSQFRQSRAARNHGPVRRLPAGHRRGGARRSISRSSPAMSRSTTRRRAPAFCRPRRSAASA